LQFTLVGFTRIEHFELFTDIWSNFKNSYKIFDTEYIKILKLLLLYATQVNFSTLPNIMALLIG